MIYIPVRTHWRTVITVLLSLLTASCVEQTTVKPDRIETEDQTSVLYYPPLPDAPRIQFLTSFSVASDVRPDKAKDSGFARFVLGEENPDDRKGPSKPYGVAVHQGRIYVVDTRGGGYAIFDVPNQEYRFKQGSGASGMPKPINMTIDDDGSKYIADTGRNRILVFDRDDKFIKTYGERDLYKPTDVAIVGDRLYVVDIEHNEIGVLDKATGRPLFTFGGTGPEPGKLFQPTNIAAGPNGHLYVSDTGNFRVQEFTPEGEYIKNIGRGVGNAPGNFARPKGVAVDRDNRLYVVDGAFQNVQIFRSDGELLLTFGEPPNLPAGLDLPTDITISYDDVNYFRQFADPDFNIEYVILVASQFGLSKINVYGFGQLKGLDYSEIE